MQGEDKLAQDVRILWTMADEMENYLDSDVLFWHIAQGGMPVGPSAVDILDLAEELALEQLSPDAGGKSGSGPTNEGA